MPPPKTCEWCRRHVLPPYRHRRWGKKRMHVYCSMACRDAAPFYLEDVDRRLKYELDRLATTFEDQLSAIDHFLMFTPLRPFHVHVTGNPTENTMTAHIDICPWCFHRLPHP